MRMPRVVGIDHLVLSVSDFRRSKAFYDEVLGFLGFKRKYDYADMAGWSNGKTLFWIAAASPGGSRMVRRFSLRNAPSASTSARLDSSNA
jgi:catechol 2,3-dioxygenase-like lactoylglutathione lyase family enzyme